MGMQARSSLHPAAFARARGAEVSADVIARWRAHAKGENVDGKKWFMKLVDLSNEELLSGLHALIGQGRILLARGLAYLGEVEERRLDLQSACSSLFDFCVRRLGMSDDEACRRVSAARLATISAGAWHD